MDVSLSKLWEAAEDREAWHAVAHGVTRSHIFQGKEVPRMHHPRSYLILVWGGS